MNILKNIIFVSYLKNKGVRRLCFVLGLLFSYIAFNVTSHNIYFTILWLYIPALVSATIRWIYIGFSKNKELQHPKTKRQELREKIEIKKIIIQFVSIAGFVITLYTVKYGISYIKNYNKIPSDEINMAIGVIYRHDIGYNKFCEKQGYPLKNYPSAFKNKFYKEINSIAQEAKENGYSLDEAYQYISKNDSLILISIKAELDSFRKTLIKELIAEETNQPAKNIELDEKYNKMITLKDTCKVFDEVYQDILSQDAEGFILLKNISDQIH